MAIVIRQEPGLASIESDQTGKGIYAYTNGRTVKIRRLWDGKFHDLDFFDFLVPDVRQFAQALLAVCDAADREEAVDYTTLPEKVFKPVKETL